MVILPEYRGLSYGKRLRDVPLTMGFDYIWGQHLKGLHNISDWTRFGRRIVVDSPELYVTLMDLHPDK